ncbi:MAG: glycosyltransferase [Muribaculaceae bacterium]
MQEPLFSIVTITYNASPTIERTIRSVASQSFNDYEHIIVDGASKDNTLEIIDRVPGKELRTVYSEPDNGLYDAMNKGLGYANGQYLIFLNAGDKFHTSDTLAEIAETIRTKNFPGVVYGQTNLVDNEGKFIAQRHLSAPDNLQYKDFARGMLVCHQAFVVLRRIAPLYNLKWRYSADYEWCLICLQHSRKNEFTGSVLIDYLSEGLTTANRRSSLIERFKIMSHYFGFWPTLWRHLGFVRRFLNHKKQLKNASI